MMVGIIGIVIGLIAIGFVFWLKKDQEMTTDLLDSDVRAIENSYKSLMEDFTNYQVDNERKITELKKQVEIKTNNSNRSIDRIQKELPNIIRNVIGHIEFAKPLDKK